MPRSLTQAVTSKSRHRRSKSQFNHIIFVAIEHEILSMVILPILLISEGLRKYMLKGTNHLKDKACPAKV